MGQCAPEDSISQCPFLQMIDTAGNPHADGSAAPGARPRHRPSRHRDPPATSRSHDNWMAARQTSCRQQTAPPQPRCSKDVTAHPHRPGARPGRPCPVPARSGQPLSGRSRFSPAFGTEFFLYVFRIFLYEIKRAMPRVVVAVCPAVAPLAVNWWPATERLRGLVEVRAWPR
jgi:hypothetical protein